MADEGERGGISGRDLQQSQITGAGDAGFTRDAMQGETGGAQLGGGPDPSDMATPGGSSGTGGYGNDQQSAAHQGQQSGGQGSGHDEKQSRGERYDEQQGGGRGTESVSSDSIAQVGGRDGSFDQHTDANKLDAAADELLRDQQAHQDRGQSETGFESDAQS